MRIITRKFLEASKVTYPKARAPLDHWHRITRAAKWQNLTQTRQSFPHADQVTVKSGRTVTLFNISNDFRLVTAIHYNRHEVFTLRFLTHAEYDKTLGKTRYENCHVRLHPFAQDLLRPRCFAHATSNP